jgi:hypothetical protein
MDIVCFSRLIDEHVPDVAAVVNDFVGGFEDAVYSQVEHVVAVEAGLHAAEVGGIIEPQRALDGGVEASSITFLSNALPTP